MDGCYIPPEILSLEGLDRLLEAPTFLLCSLPSPHASSLDCEQINSEDTFSKCLRLQVTEADLLITQGALYSYDHCYAVP